LPPHYRTGYAQKGRFAAVGKHNTPDFQQKTGTDRKKRQQAVKLWKNFLRKIQKK